MAKRAKQDKVLFHKTIPALCAYIERIGADELNFRRYMVREWKGSYYAERVLIRIDKDGNIKCSDKDYAPTKEEEAAIKAAMVTEKFPHSILARNIDDLRGLTKGTLYEFHSRKESGIIMVQERIVKDDGSKIYPPWTYWSDGQWRMMEPDGQLPFWKPYPPLKLKKLRIMIHEGAKAAEFVHTSLQDENWKHPWRDELEKYEHWGMIGGALAPHRTDYEELKRERPIEVIYICDNDWLGNAALQEISRMYGQAMKGVMFDGNWPGSWDLADAMPPKLFKKDGRYTGPSIMDLAQPATRATEKIPNPEGKGAPTTILRRPFREEWFHCVTPEVFIHKDIPNRILSAGELNNVVAPYSDVDDTARLIKKDAASKSGVLKYSPAEPSGIYGGKGGRYINTHVPSSIKPVKGDPQPFLDFMEQLCPIAEPDRLELMRWCATLIALPEVRMLYSILLISETHGVGKGTLAESILSPLVGDMNVSVPSENEVVDSNFNYWLAHKRLTIVHEIYAGQSFKAYNKLKSIITDRYVTVSKKYMANYQIENWVHIFACSNSFRALKLDMSDRRWLIPKVTEETQSKKWWDKFYSWLDDGNGLAIIVWGENDFLKRKLAVSGSDRAPDTKLKDDIGRDQFSPGMDMEARFLDRAREEGKDVSWLEATSKPTTINGGWVPVGMVIIDTDFIKVITERIYFGRQSDKLEKASTIRRVAKKSGWFVTEYRAQTDRWGTRGKPCRLICSSKELSETPLLELVEKVKPLDVMKLAQDWDI